MSKMQSLYTGSAGQAAVMSEFLMRGYNVAVPEVDRGDDLFVVEDLSGNFYRIQVKTAVGRTLKKRGYTAQFNIPRLQLELPQTPDLYFVLLTRYRQRWQDFVVIERNRLWTEHEQYGVGTSHGEARRYVKLHLSFEDTQLVCSKRDFQCYRNDFSHWPEVRH
jgi:hypothetical protein